MLLLVWALAAHRNVLRWSAEGRPAWPGACAGGNLGSADPASLPPGAESARRGGTPRRSARPSRSREREGSPRAALAAEPARNRGKCRLGRAGAPGPSRRRGSSGHPRRSPLGNPTNRLVSRAGWLSGRLPMSPRADSNPAPFAPEHGFWAAVPNQLRRVGAMASGNLPCRRDSYGERSAQAVRQPPGGCPAVCLVAQTRVLPGDKSPTAA